MMMRTLRAVVWILFGLYFYAIIRLNLWLISKELTNPAISWAAIVFAALGLLLVTIAVGHWIMFEVQDCLSGRRIKILEERIARK